MTTRTNAKNIHQTYHSQHSIKFDPSTEIVIVLSTTLSSLITKTTDNSDHLDNSKDLMFLIDVEETIDLDIQVGEQTKPKNNTIIMTSATTKSEAEISETVK